MLLAAALPCVALVVWFNKSDLISIVITLFYTIINYVIHVTDIGMLDDSRGKYRKHLTYTCNQSLDLSILRRGEWSRS